MKKLLVLSLSMLLLCAAGCASGAPGAGASQPAGSGEVLGGSVSETDPAQSVDGGDLVELYRQVIRDMWEADQGLNSEIELLGFDFSNAGLLSQEREALESLAAQDLGVDAYVTGTWDELADQGYIDRENLYWEDGLFMSIEAAGEPGSPAFTFNAQKWRSGLGAIFYDDCKVKKDRDGVWTYSVGSFGIA